MKTEKNIFIAFLLNFLFSIIEFIGGVFTGSIAIISDAVHDLGDSLSIGLSFFLEKTSRKQKDHVYTLGYGRFSILGGLITTVILLVGSILVVYNAVKRLFAPTAVFYDGMLILAVIGLVVNSVAVFFTHGGKSINQKAVNLHMLEDVFGWLIVLIGALVMRFTGWYIIDPILSIIVSVFILINALTNLKEIMEIFLMKKPKHVDIDKLKETLLKINGVLDVCDIQVFAVDEEEIFATVIISLEKYDVDVKNAVKNQAYEHGVTSVTVEIRKPNEISEEHEQQAEHEKHSHHHHHHHCHHHH